MRPISWRYDRLLADEAELTTSLAERLMAVEAEIARLRARLGEDEPPRGSDRSVRVAVLHPQTAFVRGGAETHAEALVRALKAAGHDADLVQIAGKWYPASQLAHQMAVWRSFDITESNGLKVDAVIALKFPAYLDRARAQDRLADPPAPHRVRAVGPPRVRRPLAPGRRRRRPRHGVERRPARAERGQARLHELEERAGAAVVRRCGSPSEHLYHPSGVTEHLLDQAARSATATTCSSRAAWRA